jgi:hypothetical protein
VKAFLGRHKQSLPREVSVVARIGRHRKQRVSPLRGNYTNNDILPFRESRARRGRRVFKVGLCDIDRSKIIAKFGRMISVQKLVKVRSRFRPVIINTEAHAVR